MNTSVFANHNPQRIEEVKLQFMDQRNGIKNVINPGQYLCPSYSSESLFTYLFCLEVSEFCEIPDGMIGFTISKHKYGRIKTSGDPYESIHHYLKSQGIENNSKAMAIEVYQFENPQWPDNVDVYIPIKE
ncbi:GyrI-like domain-containing protein [Paenibacillus sp. TRM 82003]|nr:GyrI-like domain-containing protein [Paenibacillus sp. TRM 82003]